MGKKDRQSMEELWSKRFDEETEINEEEPLSRKAKREREKGISPILTAFLIFMLLLAILPTSAYLWWSSREGMSEEPSGPSIEQVSESVQEEEAEELEEVEETEEENEGSDLTDSETESQNEPEEVSESDVESNETSETLESANGSVESETEDSDSSQEQDNSNDAEDTESSVDSEPVTEDETESSENASYYTVQAGDNMYRIALNHGMSTEELMQLNGISEETVYVGQELRVN